MSRKTLLIGILALMLSLCATGVLAANYDEEFDSLSEWTVKVPKKNEKTESGEYATIESAGGPTDGVKVKVKRYGYYWLFWDIENYADRYSNKWQINATIERLDKGGSGVMFGRDKAGQFMAIYLSGNKLTLVDYVTGKRTQILHEAPVSIEDQKPGTIVMRVLLQRDTQTIKCSINDTEYMNFSLAGKSQKIPEIANYGFFCGAFNSPLASTAIYKRIDVRNAK
jgi:hypothetical protein